MRPHPLRRLSATNTARFLVQAFDPRFIEPCSLGGENDGREH
jgi:hypothetical protein